MWTRQTPEHGAFRRLNGLAPGKSPGSPLKLIIKGV